MLCVCDIELCNNPNKDDESGEMVADFRFIYSHAYQILDRFENQKLRNPFLMPLGAVKFRVLQAQTCPKNFSMTLTCLTSLMLQSMLKIFDSDSKNWNAAYFILFSSFAYILSNTLSLFCSLVS